jgi:hypothetical protein
MNSTQSKLGIFGLAAQRPLYIENERILVALPQGETETFVPISSLTSWLKAFSKKVTVNSKMVDTQELRRRIMLEHFCLCQLIPYLKFLDSENEADLECPFELEQAFRDLEERVINLPEPQRNDLPQILPIDVFQDIFCVPCTVTTTHIIPLQPVGESSSNDNDITLSGLRLRRRMRLARPLNRVIAEVESAIRSELQRYLISKGIERESFNGLLNDLDRLISLWCERVRFPQYELIYKDRNHLLLYHRGNFVLVRGPLNCRPNKNPHAAIYLGVAITTTQRDQLFAVQPTCCHHPRELWMADGKPVKSGMCMGNRNQFLRLRSGELFTTEEALVHWLDAAQIIRTGITAYHKQALRLQLEAMRRRPLVKLRKPLTK